MWARIARRYPEKRFFSYTKVDHLFDFSKFRSLPNVNVIPSFIKGKLNFGPMEYVKSLGAPICPNTLGADVRCEKCRICITRQHVAFVYHDSFTAKKAAQAKKAA